MTAKADDKRELLRHLVATLAYRGGKAVRGVPGEFALFRLSDESRSASEILAHIGDLLDWALCLAKGEHTWKESAPLSWDREVERFHLALQKLDDYLITDSPLGFPPEKLFQGPIADALTHVGQIAMMRRMAGAPMRGENYFKAEIQAGSVGPDQKAPRAEF